MRLADVLRGYSPDEARDERGRWTGGGALDAMYVRAGVAKQELDGLARHIAVRVGGTVHAVPLKTRARAMEKIVNDYGGDASRIKDIARNTLIVPQGSEHAALQELLAVHPEIDRQTMVKVTDPAKDPLGYSAILVTVPTKAGVRGEIQIVSPEMVYAKFPVETATKILGSAKVRELARIYKRCCIGHALYTKWRALMPGSALAGKIAERARAYYASFRRPALLAGRRKTFVRQ